MALHRSFCLFVVISLYGVCQAQCVIRTLMPYGISIDEPQPSSCCADDLSALLMLARALEMDRAASANNGIDVNGLLNTLVHALVYTATHNYGRNSEYSSHRGSYTPHTPGYPPKGPPNGSGSLPKPGANPGNKEDDPVLGVNLLGANKPNVADVDVLGVDLLDVGLGDTSSQGKGKNGGGVTGLLDSLLG